MIGGATNSRIWNQIQADMYRLPCDTLEVEDAAVLWRPLWQERQPVFFKDIPEGVGRMVNV